MKTRGRNICDTLKAIRKQIADANGIDYSPEECNYKGECMGTCPKCEQDVRDLEYELHLRQMAEKGDNKGIENFARNIFKDRGMDFDNSFEKKLDWAASLGFDVVEHIRVTEDTIRGEIEEFSQKIEQFDLPSDGLVLVYDDLAYGKSLGRTAKFPRDSIALFLLI